MVAILSGCNKPTSDGPEVPVDKTVAVSSVTVSPTSLDLIAGNTAVLTASVLPADATDPSVSWSTSDAGIATVSSNGDVTAVAAGKANITVTTKDGGKTAVCAVTVTPAHVDVKSVSIDPSTLSMEKGQQASLTATVLPVDASDPSVIWSSSNESVATVSSDGLVIALELGNAVITVASKEDGTKKAECSIEVVKPTNVIWYKSYKDVLIEPSAYGGLGQLISNSFVDGWGELAFEASIQFLGEKVFYNCSSLLEMILPARVASIGDYAFSGCSSLTDITLPEGLESLGESAFYGCYSMTRMVLPASLTSVGIGAFSRCGQLSAFESPLASVDGRCLVVDGSFVAFAPSGLTEYSIPAGIKAIAPSTMKYCGNLQAVTIPESVESIGSYAFYNCVKLRSVTFKGTTPPELGENAFLDVGMSCRIYVPASAVSAYKSAPGWKAYVSLIEPV